MAAYSPFWTEKQYGDGSQDMTNIYPAWPLVDGALLESKGGACRPQTVC